MPRWLRTLGLPLAGLLVFTFFVIRGFPYDLLADRIAERLGRLIGAEVTIAELGPGLGLTGPAVEAGGVLVVFQDGRVFQLERARLRPAWSLSWLKLAPAIHTQFEGPLGQIEGTLTAGEAGPGAWDGTVRELDLGQLPFDPVPGLSLRGWADAEIDIVLGEAGPEGTATFLAREGSIGLPEVPMPVPFDVCKGDLLFGGESFVAVRELSLEGPLISAEVTGSVANAPQFASARLDLAIEMRAQPAIRSVLQSAGVRVGRDGVANFQVSGTPSAPIVR